MKITQRVNLHSEKGIQWTKVVDAKRKVDNNSSSSSGGWTVLGSEK